MTRLTLVVVFLAICLFSQADRSIQQVRGFTRDEQTGCRQCIRPGSDPDKRIENKWADVTDLELDKTELSRPPLEGNPPKYVEYSRDLTVGVKTTAVDPEGDLLSYNYTVSGGRIVGTGSNVFWDLNKVMPGTYTITAAVDDGCGLCGAKVTKTITVLENESAPPCLCPEIRIDALHLKIRSKDLIFTVYMSGPERPRLTYNWTISEGTIISGQGTRTIKVPRPQEQTGQPRTVTVEVSGLDANCQCPNTASKTF